MKLFTTFHNMNLVQHRIGYASLVIFDVHHRFTGLSRIQEEVIHVLVVLPEGTNDSASEANAMNKLIKERHKNFTQHQGMKQYAHSKITCPRVSSYCKTYLL